MSCWILIFSSYRRNIGSDLKTCVYDPDKDPLCPIIKLGTIVKQAGQDYNELAFEVKKYPVLLPLLSNHKYSIHADGARNAVF